MKIYQTLNGDLFYIFMDDSIWQIYIDGDYHEVVKAVYFKDVLLEHVNRGIQEGLLKEYKGSIMQHLVKNLIQCEV